MELLKNLEGLSADEQMTAVVELQKAAMKTLEEQKQASIGKSAELVIQGLKKIKSDFEAKFDSLNYDIQTKVASLKDGEQGLQGPKGDQGERGLDGSNGRDGRDGKDGRDGLNGQDGVGVRDAKIDFDGSLVITLTDGREINVGEVVSVDVAKQIQKVTHNIQTGAGGDSQTVLDAIAAIQATIATYGTMATQNANNVAITGGTINNTTIGATTPSTGVFTTLTATGQTSLGGDSSNPSLRANVSSGVTRWIEVSGSVAGDPLIQSWSTGSSTGMDFSTRGTGNFEFRTASNSNLQAVIAHTASAVNYVQVTGAATTLNPTFTSTGSDANVGFDFRRKGGGTFNFYGDSYLGVNGNNSWLIGGAVTGLPPRIIANGSDTNISAVFQSKGTGAIDLAAGSSGVNISNGGTVTALTRSVSAFNYTSQPSVVISAPTTAGGVQATATQLMYINTAPVTAGGTGYTVGDILTVVGGTPFTTAATLTVSAVSAGVITAVTSTNFNSYSVLPSSPVSVTGGTGTGATFSPQWGNGSLVITNAGSGYVEQPTVTFSGGGGSGAAAYASVGSGSVIRALGATGSQSLSFFMPGGEGLRIRDTGGSADTYPMISPSSALTTFVAQGNANASMFVGANGSGSVRFSTNGTSVTEQLRVSHTASAVNYVQVTGAATGNRPTISAQGSDTNIGIGLQSKGTFGLSVLNSAGGLIASVTHSTTTSSTNYVALQASAGGATNPAGVAAVGTDTNIDLALTPKGTGRVKFGTYTANMALTVQGYIEIVDSGGTIRKLAVIA